MKKSELKQLIREVVEETINFSQTIRRPDPLAMGALDALRKSWERDNERDDKKIFKAVFEYVVKYGTKQTHRTSGIAGGYQGTTWKLDGVSVSEWNRHYSKEISTNTVNVSMDNSEKMLWMKGNGVELGKVYRQLVRNF